MYINKVTFGGVLCLFTLYFFFFFSIFRSKFHIWVKFSTDRVWSLFHDKVYVALLSIRTFSPNTIWPPFRLAQFVTFFVWHSLVSSCLRIFSLVCDQYCVICCCIVWCAVLLYSMMCYCMLFKWKICRTMLVPMTGEKYLLENGTPLCWTKREKWYNMSREVRKSREIWMFNQCIFKRDNTFCSL